MREFDAQPAEHVAPCLLIIYGYVCVADSLTLHMITTEWTQDWCNLLSTNREMDTVCVDAMLSPQCMLHPASL